MQGLKVRLSGLGFGFLSLLFSFIKGFGPVGSSRRGTSKKLTLFRLQLQQ